MRDWTGYVRKHLGSMRVGPGEAEEVAEELAGHMGECDEALRAAGLPEEEAFARTCERAGNWMELRREVSLGKRAGTMQERVGQFWLPSLVTLFTAWSILAIFIWAGIQPFMTHPAEPRGLIVYVPWLAVLPLIGALGAYLSRRAEAKGWRVYVAGAFPAVAIACVFALIFPFGLIVDPHVVHDFEWISLAAGTFSWVVVPGIALCTGVALQGLCRWKSVMA